MRVLISGAGIAGPTLAWFLAEIGARVTVLERAQTLLPHGQNIDIRGSAVTAIKKMGLLDQVKKFNTTESGTEFIGPSGQPFALFPVKEGSASSFTSEYEILRGDLAKVLYEATKDKPNVDYVFGTTIKNVISNGEKTVKVELSDGEVQEYDLLVAADGQWSKVRSQCFPPESITVVDKGLYVGYFTIPRLPSDNNYWRIYQALGSRIVSLRPDPHGTTRAMLSRMPCNEAQTREWREASKSGRQAQQDLLRRELADAGWQAERVLEAMDQAPDFYFQPVQQIKMTKWSSSRVVCLGDTAYAPTPLTGMGTSLAITGAYMLAGELSGLRDGEHPSRALEAYEAAFRPFVEEVQKIPSFVPAIAHPESAWKRWLLQTAVWGVSKIVAIPWIPTRAGGESDDDGFPLPQYPAMIKADSRQI